MTTISGKIRDLQRIKGTVLDKNRIIGSVAAILLQGAGGGLVSIDDTNTRIDDDYLLQFDQNEFYSDCYLIDINAPNEATISLDPDFNHISGVEKTFLIAGTGVELKFGLGFHLLSGEFDTTERSVNIVQMLYSEVSGVWVTITNQVVGEDVTIKAPIPADDTKVDKLEGYSLVSDTEITKIHSQNTDNQLKSLDGGTIVSVEDLATIMDLTHPQNTDTILDDGGANEVSAAEIRDVVDFANIATPPDAYTIPVVQDVAGVKSLKYSADFVFENGTLKVKGAGNTTGKTLSLFNSTPTEILTVLDNGNVGIGQVNPAHNLDIKGTLRITGVSHFGAYNIFGDSSQGFMGVASGIFTGGGTSNLGIRFPNTLFFGTSLTNIVMTMLNTNKIGINTTTPAKSLEVSHATGDCFRLSYDKSTTYKADFTLDASGNLTIAPAGRTNITGDLNVTGVIYKDGTQILRGQQDAVADATNSSDVITQLNTLLERLRNHGLIAT